jgi:hypothetical protein
MADSIPSRPGQNLGTGDARAKFKILFLAEVMRTYLAANVTGGRFMTRTITEGKSADFPVVGLAGGGFHTPGQEVLGRIIKNTSKTINLDDILLTDSFVADIDQLMNHWDVMTEYTAAQGNFLARVDDIYALAICAQAARSSATIPGESAPGARLINASALTNADVLADLIFSSATRFDEIGVPQEDRAAYLRPTQYHLLVKSSTRAANRDYSGSGNYASGVIEDIAGIPLVKTPNLPHQDLSDDDAIAAAGLFTAASGNPLPSHAWGDYSTTAGIVAQKGAIGTLKLMGMTNTITPMEWKQGTLILTKQLIGRDVLRPECAIELATAALS